jgi:cobaltochelatase CobS
MTFAASTNGAGLPDMSVSVRQVFGIDTNLEVPAYSQVDEHVPDVDPDYLFNREVTLAILAGFKHNRRVMIQGYHGTGKSTHIEQVAARLNWPCMRINLDSHVSRIDLVGKDAIVIRDGQQVTEFREGILPYALQSNTALCFDEYDAGRPDVMFVIQRVLEVSGKLAPARARCRPPSAGRPVPQRRPGSRRRRLTPAWRYLRSGPPAQWLAGPSA